MQNLKVKPTSASLRAGKAVAVVVAIIGTGMISAAAYLGLTEGGGAFVVVWIIACLGIIGVALYSAFSRKGMEEGYLSIEPDGGEPDDENPATVEERLKTLDRLKSKGLIGTEEYRKQRERILQSI